MLICILEVDLIIQIAWFDCYPNRDLYRALMLCSPNDDLYYLVGYPDYIHTFLGLTSLPWKAMLVQSMLMMICSKSDLEKSSSWMSEMISSR